MTMIVSKRCTDPARPYASRTRTSRSCDPAPGTPAYRIASRAVHDAPFRLHAIQAVVEAERLWLLGREGADGDVDHTRRGTIVAADPFSIITGFPAERMDVMYAFGNWGVDRTHPDRT